MRTTIVMLLIVVVVVVVWQRGLVRVRCGPMLMLDMRMPRCGMDMLRHRGRPEGGQRDQQQSYDASTHDGSVHDVGCRRQNPR